MVGLLAKLRQVVPCKSAYSSYDLADLFLHHVWMHHSLPDTIISDRGPQFALLFKGDFATLFLKVLSKYSVELRR